MAVCKCSADVSGRLLRGRPAHPGRLPGRAVGPAPTCVPSLRTHTRTHLLMRTAHQNWTLALSKVKGQQSPPSNDADARAPADDKQTDILHGDEKAHDILSGDEPS
eukprot:2215788-Prymnesium_polylepis.1